MTQADADELRYYRAVLAAISRWELQPRVYVSDGMWRFAMECHDVYFPSIEASVTITLDNVAELDRSMLDGGRLWGVMLFICRCRRQSPGKHWSGNFPDQRIADLFAECDEPRPIIPISAKRAERWTSTEPDGLRFVGPDLKFSRHTPEPDCEEND